MEWDRDGIIISDDSARLDLALIHGYLAQSYWAEGIPLETVRASIANSLAFGIYRDSRQVGFARVITDRATFAYLADVFVVEAERGQGLARWLMQVIMGHPDLQGLRRWMLATRGAHALYAKFGFEPPANPENLMQIVVPDIYLRR